MLLLLSAWLTVSCGRSGYTEFGGYAQGGTWRVKANLSGVESTPEEIQARMDGILEDIDNSLSGYNKNSILSRFNAGEAVRPDAIFLDMYARAYRLWEESGGALDCAAGPLFDIWGFGFRNDSLPDPELVRRTMETCGMGRLLPDLEVDGKGFARSGGARLNFNAIAQGYSCDLIADYLHSIGVSDMLVDIGEIYCEGLNPKGQPWRVGIDRPTDGNNTPGADLDGIWESSGGKGCGVVTSGNYRKFYIKDGVKYSHTIDPRTGYPVEHNLLSATIIAPSALLADAYATCCMVVGFDEAMAFIESRDDVEGYLICGSAEGMSEWASDGFRLIKK